MAELNRPETIPGYEHPTSSNYSRQSIYKTFTEGQTKKEPFGKTTKGKHYANYGDTQEETCPQCNSQAVNTCQCAYSDKRCAKGHIWFTDRDGTVKYGNPHAKAS